MENIQNRKIDISSWKTLDSVVYLLLAYKADGKHVYCDFNGHRLYSDTVSMESAYSETGGKNVQKSESYNTFESQFERETNAKLEREKLYADRIYERNHGKQCEISKDAVVKGLKFIAENRQIDQYGLIDALLDLGCEFTLKDCKREAPVKDEDKSIEDGIKEGDYITGARIICFARDSEYGRSFTEEKYLKVDDDKSIYELIRKITNDKSYSKKH